MPGTCRGQKQSSPCDLLAAVRSCQQIASGSWAVQPASRHVLRVAVSIVRGWLRSDALQVQDTRLPMLSYQAWRKKYVRSSGEGLYVVGTAWLQLPWQSNLQDKHRLTLAGLARRTTWTAPATPSTPSLCQRPQGETLHPNVPVAVLMARSELSCCAGGPC